MLSGVSIFSGAAKFPKGSLSGGVVSQIAARLKEIVESLLESSQEVNHAGIHSERLWSRLNEELANQQSVLQRELICRQDIMQQQKGELTPLELPHFENHFQGVKQCVLDIVEFLETRKSVNLHSHPFKSVLEAKLVKNIGKLKGWMDANQFSSLPANPILIKINKMIVKILLFQIEVNQEMIRVYFQGLELMLRIHQINERIAESVAVVINQSQKGGVDLAFIEDGSDLAQCSARISRLIQSKNDWKEVFHSSIKALSAVPEGYGGTDGIETRIIRKATERNQILQIGIMGQLTRLEANHKIDKRQDLRLRSLVESFLEKINVNQKQGVSMITKGKKFLDDTAEVSNCLAKLIDNVNKEYFVLIMETALKECLDKIEKVINLLKSEYIVDIRFFDLLTQFPVEFLDKRLRPVDVLESNIKCLFETSAMVSKAYGLNSGIEHGSQDASSSVGPAGIGIVVGSSDPSSSTPD